MSEARKILDIRNLTVSFRTENGSMRVIRGVNFDDYEGLSYFERLLQTSGVIDKLREAGCQEGDTVSIYDLVFDFIE